MKQINQHKGFLNKGVRKNMLIIQARHQIRTNPLIFLKLRRTGQSYAYELYYKACVMLNKNGMLNKKRNG